MMGKYRDIIIQTSSAGMEGNDTDDPAEMYSFCGREEVMDLVYKPEMTAFLKRAADAGCRVQNGRDMFVRQACSQYSRFTGKEFPEHLLPRVEFGS
jgi:3-dehydroquinate dehydratase/shikimate dehydrogenase